MLKKNTSHEAGNNVYVIILHKDARKTH